MATQIIQDGPKNVVVKIDGVGTASGTAITVTTLSPPCTRVRINQIWFSCPTTGSLNILWDATTDVLAFNCQGSQDFCFDIFGGLPNNAGAGNTGNVNFAGVGTGNWTAVIFATKTDPTWPDPN